MAVRERLHAALSQTSPAQMIQDVKNAVIGELVTLDRHLRIQKTDYFSHTFVPDLVLNWEESGRSQSREVFLRRDTSEPGVATDISDLASEAPLFVGLENPESEVEWSKEVKQAANQHDEVFVTDATALSTFNPAVQPSFADIIGSSLLRGGRGVLSQDRSKRIDRITREALGPSQEEEVKKGKAMAGALNLLRQNLEESFDARIERYFYLAWLADDHDPERFPGRPDAGFMSSSEIVPLLEHLFSGEEVTNDRFWSAIGQYVSLQTLEELGNQASHPNLHRLVQANAANINARFAAVVRWMDKLEKPFAWRISNGFLELTSGSDLTFRFALSGERFAYVAPSQGPWMRELKDRLGARVLTKVQSETGSFELALASKEAGAALNDEFEKVTAAVGAAGRVHRADFTIAGVTAHCDFGARRLRTDAALTVHRLASELAALVAGLNESQQEKLTKFLGDSLYAQPDDEPDEDLPDEDEPGREQLGLFDDAGDA